MEINKLSVFRKTTKLAENTDVYLDRYPWLKITHQNKNPTAVKVDYGRVKLQTINK